MPTPGVDSPSPCSRQGTPTGPSVQVIHTSYRSLTLALKSNIDMSLEECSRYSAYEVTWLQRQCVPTIDYVGSDSSLDLKSIEHVSACYIDLQKYTSIDLSCDDTTVSPRHQQSSSSISDCVLAEESPSRGRSDIQLAICLAVMSRTDQ